MPLEGGSDGIGATLRHVDPPGMPVPLTVSPGDFCVLPMAPPAGPYVKWGQWALQVIDSHRLSLPQRYEHAEVWLPDPSGKSPFGYTASAYPDRKGIRPLSMPPEEIPGALWSTGLIDLTSEQRDGIVTWCNSHRNVQYGTLVYPALALHGFGVSASWLDARIKATGQMICSMYVDAAYQANGIQLFSDHRWPGFVDPLELALLLESMGARVRKG